MVQISFPEKLQALFQPKRYKVLHGGRGGGKSWGIARALLLQGTKKPLRVLCARELQISIRESVHKLLSDQIAAMELEGYYQIEVASIKGPEFFDKNGKSLGRTEFFFEGIKNNVNKIKSYEGIDICWVEEAHAVSKNSWNTLIPTIRKDGSEIWISFNPVLATDYTYQRFKVKPPEDSTVIEINWNDNPWFSSAMRVEMETLRREDEDEYLHVWGGQTKKQLEGAVYGKELRKAREEKRICRVTYDESRAVDVFFDLGWADTMVMWFVQKLGIETRCINYYENSQQPIKHYLDYIQSLGYTIGTLYLPHDGKAKSLQTGMSTEQIVRKSGFKVKIVPKLSLADGINAARTMFSNVWIDEEKCADGIAALEHYRYEIDHGAMESAGLSKKSATKFFSKEPIHDWASHAADGYRYVAVGYKPAKPSFLDRLNEVKQDVITDLIPYERAGWMAR